MFHVNFFPSTEYRTQFIQFIRNCSYSALVPHLTRMTMENLMFSHTRDSLKSLVIAEERKNQRKSYSNLKCASFTLKIHEISFPLSILMMKYFQTISEFRIRIFCPFHSLMEFNENECILRFSLIHQNNLKNKLARSAWIHWNFLWCYLIIILVKLGKIINEWESFRMRKSWKLSNFRLAVEKLFT